MASLFIGSNTIARLLKVQIKWFDEIVKTQIETSKKGNPISFTDASSIVLCKKFNIPKIISFDSHFDGILTQIN